jgi:hypothetical protein
MRKLIDKLKEYGVFVFASAPVLMVAFFVTDLNVAPIL